MSENISVQSVVDEPTDVEVIFKAEEDSIEPPSEEWSSLICLQNIPVLNAKEVLYNNGLYEPPSSELCVNYLPLSDSSVVGHPYYDYPMIVNPKVEAALLEPPPSVTYPDDGQDFYWALCKEMNEAPCKLFLKGLLNKHISLSYYGISPRGFRAMALALKNNRTVESIDFTNNFISVDGCFHFGEILAENYTLTELNFKGCRMGPDGVKGLVANLRKNYTLKKINLASNELTDEGVAYVTEAIYKGANFTNIDLSYNNITRNSIQSLTSALEMNNILTTLNLSWNQFGSAPKIFEDLANVLVDNERFVEMDLSWNSLSSRFGKALSIILKIPNLKVLNVSNNNLCDEAISEICACLPSCKTLDTLDLSYNPITVPDAKMLLRYMAQRRVKLNKLLLDDVNVDHQFFEVKERILTLKFKQHAVITHGYVYRQNNVPAPDMRRLVLSRAQVVCSLSRHAKTLDFAMIILELNKRLNGACVVGSELESLIADAGIHNFNSELIDEFVDAFPGPKSGKIKTCKVSAMAEFVRRLWPDKKLPPASPDVPNLVLSTQKPKK